MSTEELDNLKVGDEVFVNGHAIRQVNRLTPSQFEVLGHGMYWKKNGRGVGNNRGYARRATADDHEYIVNTRNKNFVLGFRLHKLTTDQINTLAEILRSFEQ